MLKEQKEAMWLSQVVQVDGNPLHVRWTMQIHKSELPDSFWPNCQFTFEAVFDSVRVQTPPSHNDRGQVTFISPEHVSIFQQHHCACAERRIDQHHCECNTHHGFKQTLRNVTDYLSRHSEISWSWSTLELDVARYVQACPRCHTEPDKEKSYPQVAPHVTCKTPIYHPNIANQPSGKVCLSSLNNWKPETTLWHIIENGLWTTQFQDPNGNDPLPDCHDAASLFLSDKGAFRRNAKSHAERHKTFIPGSREHRGY